MTEKPEKRTREYDQAPPVDMVERLIKRKSLEQRLKTTTDAMEKAKKALEYYGQHIASVCQWVGPASDRKCSCGLKEAIQEIRRDENDQ